MRRGRPADSNKRTTCEEKNLKPEKSAIAGLSRIGVDTSNVFA
jgi:hypothetical protein